ncbi:butyryl-CoA dehydrogenase [Alicycliphilus sp. B1]|nr:butyryl-CoA dehydrogenase [Alicycliphilus sp. B1]
MARGTKIGAFALSEPDAGSDVAALSCRAEADGDGYVLNGSKTWISNGGLADFYCVFARTQADAVHAAFRVSWMPVPRPERGRLHQRDLAPPAGLAPLRELQGSPKLHAGATRPGVQAGHALARHFPCLGCRRGHRLARRAMQEGLQHATRRRMFGQTLADFQLTQAAFGTWPRP